MGEWENQRAYELDLHYGGWAEIPTRILPEPALPLSPQAGGGSGEMGRSLLPGAAGTYLFCGWDSGYGHPCGRPFLTHAVGVPPPTGKSVACSPGGSVGR